jgi:type I restriction enzyme R subunit
MNGEQMGSTNFEFLRPKWPELANLGGYAELYAHTDPPSSRIKSRTLAEHLALRVCDRLRLPLADDNFLSMLKELERSKAIPKTVLDRFHQIRISGNKAAHSLDKTNGNALEIVIAAFDLARWWSGIEAGSFADIPKKFQPIKSTASPNPRHEIEQVKKLQQITNALIAENEQLRRQQATLGQDERDILQENTRTDFRKKATKSADALQFNEQETRKRLIDTMLLAAGWDVHDPDQVQTEFELDGQDTPTGVGRADYVLYDDNGTALAVLEAKRTAKDPDIGRKQAQEYADALEKKNLNGERPLIILSNGYETTLVDDRGGPASLGVIGYADRQIYGIPSKDSLRYRVRFQREAMRDPSQIPHRRDIADRPYQVEAIKAVAECFGEHRRRKALIVQATGTGKTRVAIALADLLMRAGFARRILFLCDRKELRRQAKTAFTQCLPDSNVSLLTRYPDAAAQVILATYPAMMHRFQNYDVAWFDLVIADESHRSIYNKYRDLFLYFDALQIGLTATPRDKVSHNTYTMFDCRRAGDPTYY